MVSEDAAGSSSLTSLARLAVDTGGRFTERTNDLTLGYARAQRDLGCTYTVGLYVPESEEDRPRNVTVRVKRPGLRAIHPSKYVFRSKGEKRESLLRAAWAAPELFQTGLVRAHAFPLRPSPGNSWDALLAVSFEVPLAGSDGADVRREFGAVLHRGTRVAHRFNRRIALQALEPGVTSEPSVTFLEPVHLAPGDYTLTAVLSTPGAAEAHATRINLTVPRIPQEELFLVGPILGRPAGTDLVVTGDGRGQGGIGAENAFAPLLVQQLDDGEDLVALTQACFVGKKKKSRKVERAGGRLQRTLHGEDGDELGWMEPERLALDEATASAGKTEVRCQNLADIIPGASLPGGEFVFDVRLTSEGGGGETSRAVRFVIDEPPAGPAAGAGPGAL